MSSQPVLHWQTLNPTQAPDLTDLAARDAAGLPPLFVPAVRTVVDYPSGEVEIAPPLQRPGIPSTSIVNVLLPILGLVIMAIVSILVMGGRNAGFLYMTAPLMVVSAGGGIYSFFRERKKYKVLLEKREKDYLAHLADCSRQLEALRQQQIRASLTPHPEPNGCMERARLRDPERRLWERSPRDADFLALRLGTGKLPATYAVKFSLSAADRLSQDDLARKARAVADEYASVDGSAVVLPLGSLGVVGGYGTRQNIQHAARAMIMQIAANHAPSEVKIVLAYPDDEAEEWAWARWLPHIWNQEGDRRYIAGSLEKASALLADLSLVFNQRQISRRKNQRPDEVRFFPHFVFILADPEVIDQANDSPYSKLFAILMNESTQLGASVALFHGARQRLDRACAAVINLKNETSLTRSGPGSETTPFTLDRPDRVLADRFARTLAPIRLNMRARDQEKGGALVKSLTLFELLNITRPEDLDFDCLWKHTCPEVKLAGPIGKQAEGITFFSLQEGTVDGLGPHAVIGGTTGTGKTKGLLHTIILSLAIHNHPHDLNFLLIDYKGGDLFEKVRALPHVVGYLGNLEGTQKQGALTRRLFTCLEAELTRRRNLLGGMSINDFHREQALRSYKPEVRLPHLVVVIDEFRELIQKNPPDVAEYLKLNLATIASTGRSLGIHLLLATQDPGEVLRGTGAIRDAINLFICLGMGTPDASRELLDTEDAYIGNPWMQLGRGYFKAKRENLYTQFQVAYSGASIEMLPDGATRSEHSVRELYLNGQPGRQLYPAVHQRSAIQASETLPVFSTQLDSLVFRIANYAAHNGLRKLPNPFLQLLKDTYDLSELRDASSGWDGTTWRAPVRALDPIVGICDDPAGLDQPVLSFNLTRDGHLTVYGNDNAEVTAFLTTLVVSMALDRSPEHLHLYLIDFGGQGLNPLRVLPHVGDLVNLEESEKTQRLIGLLHRKLKERKDLLSASDFASFNMLQGWSAKPLPEIVVVLNNFTQFDTASTQAVELLVQLVDQGAAAFGIHLVVTGNRTGAISRRISNLAKLAVALELSPDDDASGVVGYRPPKIAHLPGRGLVRRTQPLEFQTASVNAIELVQQMALAWDGPRPPEVPILKESVSLKELQDEANRCDEPHRLIEMPVPLGIHVDTLETLATDLLQGPAFLVTGRSKGGKTTAIQSWLLGLASRYSPQELRFAFVQLGPVNQRLFLLRGLRHCMGYADTEAAAVELAAALKDEIQSRKAAFQEALRTATDLIDEQEYFARFPALVLVLDDYDQTLKALQNKAWATDLETLLRLGLGMGLYVIESASYKEISDPVTRLVRESQSGILLDRTDPSSIFSSQSPKNMVGQLPPGRGYLVAKGIYQPVQVAWANHEGMGLGDWIQQTNQKYSET